MRFLMEKYHVLNIPDNLIYMTVCLGKKAEKYLSNDSKWPMLANQVARFCSAYINRVINWSRLQ